MSDRPLPLANSPTVGTVVWFTGLSGAGKSTLATALRHRLQQEGLACVLLDGDDLRRELCADLGFTEADRRLQMTRTSSMARLLVQQGLIVLVSLISPLADVRSAIKASHLPRFLEVYCAAPFAICRQRDVKGLYQKAQRGEIPLMTGIASTYEAPVAADVILDTGAQTQEESLAILYERFSQHWQTLTSGTSAASLN